MGGRLDPYVRRATCTNGDGRARSAAVQGRQAGAFPASLWTAQPGAGVWGRRSDQACAAAFRWLIACTRRGGRDGPHLEVPYAGLVPGSGGGGGFTGPDKKIARNFFPNQNNFAFRDTSWIWAKPGPGIDSAPSK